MKSKENKKAQAPSDAELAATMDYAGTAIFLLSDYRRFGLAERVCYHFDLIEALVSHEKSSSFSQSDGTVSGVAGLLEFTPLGPWNRFLKRQKRALKNQLRAFNMECDNVRETHSTLCYQPQNLPLGLHPSSKLFFAYEVTRIVFCVDASPSLTSTFGATGNSRDDHCCPLDRLPEMARTFFKSLVADVSTSISEAGVWRPELAVTVIAVYPLGQEVETSLLIRDYRVKDVASAEILASKIDKWIHSEVEAGISERMCRHHSASTWCVPLYSSSMRDILETADYALSVLSSEARPLIVVATDGRSVNCEGIVDVYLDTDRVDIPVFVLDLSMPNAHSIMEQSGQISKNELNFLTYDPANPSSFPLHLSDDSGALYGICRATGGCYLDYQLLLDASNTVAGGQPGTEASYHYSFKRRFVKMNGMQWLALFSLSPLSPTFHSSWGKLAPPQYLQKHLKLSTVDSSIVNEGQSITLNFSRHESFIRQTSEPRSSVIRSVSDISSPTHKKTNANSRVTFSTYVVSPIRIKALLLIRIKEGYRTKQYGSSTQDADKVFIQFIVPLQLGTVLHYELSYTALSNKDHTVGSAHIKIELSGNLDFIQSVKNDFLRPVPLRPSTMAQKVSSRLCQVLRWIRTEDLKCSYLSPPAQWSDQLGSPHNPFVRRIDSLTPLQRLRYFQFHEFDIVFTGRMPYAIDDDFLSEFLPVDNGEQELFEHLSDWSTQIIKPASRYVKQMTTSSGMTSYCVINVEQSTITSRLCSVTVEFYGGTDPSDRLDVLNSLKSSIYDLKDVEVLDKQIMPYLVGVSNTSFSQRGRAKIEYHHERWDLINDPELFPLLMKRRLEIGSFKLLDSNLNSAIFAKLVEEAIDGTPDSPGDLIQYQISILSDKVAIDLHMESEGGIFSPFQSSSRFNALAERLRSRDQQCGRALRSRTNLLKAILGTEAKAESEIDFEDHRSSAERILAYSSRVSRKLRFFNHSVSSANDILCQMTEDLLLSEPFGVRAAKLVIEPGELIKDEDRGLWFVIQYDRDTMSVVHLSLNDKEDKSDLGKQTYRNLTFFTSTISDLYSKRDDMVGDDDSADSHISEYLCVTDFADHFEDAMKWNFAAASYLSLRRADSSIPHDDFEGTDFENVLQTCNFLEVTSVFVLEEHFAEDEEGVIDPHLNPNKLYQLILTILQPVPGSDECMFYCGNGLGEIPGMDGDGSVLSATSEESEDMVLSPQSTEDNPEEEGFEDDAAAFGLAMADIDEMTPFHKSAPPIFVRFNLNGERASLKDLQSISKKSKLTAQISAFKTEGQKEGVTGSNHGLTDLPWSHQTVSIELTALLKSYVAEQTIENLRRQGRSISESNLELVTRYLKRVRTVVSFTIEAYFYVSKTDQMVLASAPAGRETEVEEGFILLNTELLNTTDFTFKPTTTEGGFVVFPKEGEELAFWCFVNVKKGEGIVSQMYHPGGEEKASEVMSGVYSVVNSCVHRVNQKLLLKSLHRSRTASTLLIPDPGQRAESLEPSFSDNKFDQFCPGMFSCPIVFAKEFELYYRCALNPSQVARTLEATVLDSFAVSNRARIFVYKDESEAIFYMRLQAIGSGIDGDGKVELLVHGVHAPGPSVTKQLRSLLQRRLLLIAVDMLSSVLSKNPHFNWKVDDFRFLRSFENDWANLEEDTRATVEAKDRFYEFPAEVDDPCMVLLMFRQNICGSTFFHRLNDMGDSSLSLPITLSRKLDTGGAALKWNQHIFTLYYNNTPSKLDPSYQGLSTLTGKGEILCREAGIGLAMFELSLVNSDGQPLDEEIYFGRPRNITNTVAGMSTQSPRFRKLDNFQTKRKAICLRVHITGTTPNYERLHELVSLSLDQALIGWYAERLVEKISWTKLQPNRPEKDDASPTFGSSRNITMDPNHAGMIDLRNILASYHDLPHPGIIKIENHGIIRSSAVATSTLELLENCILPLALADSSTQEIMKKVLSNLRIFRQTQSGRPELVSLSWDSLHREAVVTEEAGETIKDSSVECPEYICFFCLTEHDGRRIEPSTKLYEEVMVHDNISDWSPSIELLTSVKKENPQSFHRSLAFVFSVKRNVRTLLTYNFNPQIVKSISTRLQESNLAHVRETSRGVALLQNRCLRILAPSSGFHDAKEKQISQQQMKKENPNTSSPNNKLFEGQESRAPRSSKIRRPVSIRRPKLIGKSVEGSAAQAVAASRRRASSNQFKNITSMPTPLKRSNRNLVRQTSTGSSVLDSPNTKDATARGSRHPSESKSMKAEEEQDENLAQVRMIYSLAKQDLRRRLGTLQCRALVKLSSTWWPQKKINNMPRSVGQFLINKAPLAWSDTRPFPPMPRGTSDLFISTFARFITAFTPNLKFLSLTSTQTEPKHFDSVILSSDIKNVRGCKCLVAVQISRVVSSEGTNLVNCRGVILNLPRRSKTEQRAKVGANTRSTLSLEKDAAGMDKLSFDLHQSLVLDSLLFDFSASMVERAVRLLDEKIDRKSLIPTVRDLISHYPLEAQKRMPKLNYRAFEATIVLKSYCDRFIGMFDGEELFQGLYDEAEDLDMIRCNNGLCFKKGISVRGCHSVCFLTPNETDLSKMQLVILCRTQGRNLSDFMFREGSNVAIHIIDNIVFEASCLAFKELRLVAKKLLKDSLWKLFSSKRRLKKRANVQDDLIEMLELTTVRPLQHLLGNILNGHPEIMALFEPETNVDWAACCLAMQCDESFAPSWSLVEGDIITHLFYLEPQDVFVLIGIDKSGALSKAGLVEKDKSITLERRQSTIQKISNFLLHFIWYNL